MAVEDEVLPDVLDHGAPDDDVVPAQHDPGVLLQPRGDREVPLGVDGVIWTGATHDACSVAMNLGTGLRHQISAIVRILDREERAGSPVRTVCPACAYPAGATRMSAPIAISRHQALLPLIRYWEEKKVEAMIAQAKIVARLRNGRFLTFCATRRTNRNSGSPLTVPPPDR
jgi:hypothetical protein